MSDQAKQILLFLGAILGLLLLVMALWKVGPWLGSMILDVVNAVWTFVTWVVAAAVGLIFVVLAGVLPVYIGLHGFRLAATSMGEVVTAIGDVGTRIDKLQDKVTADARDTASDAIFLAALACLAGLVFFVGTGDFMGDPKEFPKELSEELRKLQAAVRILAVSAVFCAILKMLAMMPVRPVKIFASLLFGCVVTAIVGYLVAHYQLFVEPRAAAEEVRKLLGKANFFTALALLVISLTFLVALLYPFSLQRWRKMLWPDKPSSMPDS